jgi:hypothetical protein
MLADELSRLSDKNQARLAQLYVQVESEIGWENEL